MSSRLIAPQPSRPMAPALAGQRAETLRSAIGQRAAEAGEPTVGRPGVTIGLAKADGRLLASSIILIVAAAVCYNAALAFVNAHGVNIGPSSVVLTEVVILVAACSMIIASGRKSSDTLGFLLLAMFIIDALLVSIASSIPYIVMARNGTIIALFFMLGCRVDEVTIKRCFLVCSILVLAVLLLDAFAVKAYVNEFMPSRYFELTRGVEPLDVDQLGLFRNALGFSERFSISHLSDHRTSSLFLEQVSLANFSTILVIYLTAMWQRISGAQKIFYFALIVSILLTNNSRTGLILALLAPAAYWLAPRLNRFAPLAVMPLVLVAAAIVAVGLPNTDDDTLAGRVGLTMRFLANVDLPAALGRSTSLAAQFADSGYLFVIYSMSIMGLVLVWLFVSLVLVFPGAAQRRCGLMVNIYMFGNLLIGGSAVFTIKVASLLWLLVGFLRQQALDLDGISAAPLGGRPPSAVQRLAFGSRN